MTSVRLNVHKESTVCQAGSRHFLLLMNISDQHPVVWLDIFPCYILNTYCLTRWFYLYVFNCRKFIVAYGIDIFGISIKELVSFEVVVNPCQVLQFHHIFFFLFSFAIIPVQVFFIVSISTISCLKQ